MRTILSKVKAKIHAVDSLLHPVVEESNCLKDSILNQGIPNALFFSWDDLKKRILHFVSEMQSESDYEFKYSNSTETCCIYNSVYVCMILSLFNEICNKEKSFIHGWLRYFDSYQEKETGFFTDERIVNNYWTTADWWGARHLCPHIINAYTALGGKPKYEFNWVKEYYNLNILKNKLDTCNWDCFIPDENDIDNFIMNVGCILQYQRDFWNDQKADTAVTFLKDYLRKCINKETGFWGTFDPTNNMERCRMIQFSYHLFRIFFNDKEYIAYPERIIDNILLSQNKLGGWGNKLNSSACEDIDALNILTYISSQNDYRKEDVKRAIEYSMIFVLANQNEDGGFVFRRDEPLWYGSTVMSSMKNESAMFPTWFRLLCLAYMCKYLGIGNFKFVDCPGY